MSQNIAASFIPFEERMRQEGLPEIVINNFHYHYSKLLSGSMGMIAENEISPVTSIPEISEVVRYREIGHAAVKHTAVLKLNGGLGTNMGLEKAKSLLAARSDLTFLDIVACQNICFSAEHQCRVPLSFLNSFVTDADSRAVLASYPELVGPIPLILMQHKVPKVLQDTLAPAEWPENPDLEWCPPGHGEVYIALATSGMLDSLIASGYEYLFISNVDNLGATLDLGILGYMASQGIPFIMEVTDRTEADRKGGHITRRRDGQLILREIAQCPDQDLPAFQDIKRHKYFNTNNVWLSLSRLKQTLAEHNNVIELPMIRNAKTLDPKDSDSPKVYQLETAMGAAIEIFPGAQVLRVGRDRFMPVKTCEDLLRLRSDFYELDEHYRLRQARAAEPTAVALDSRYYKLIDDFEARFAEGVPSLRNCARLVVQGDVRFAANVVCKGDVRIINCAAEQRRLPPACMFDQGEYDLT